MSSRLIKSILLVSLLFNFFIIAAAGYFYYKENWCRTDPDRVGKRHAELVKKLDLTPEQKRLIDDEHLRFKKEMDKTRGELVEKRERLFKLIKEEETDRGSIDALIAEISGLQASIEAQVIGHILNEKAALDKDQQEKYMELLEKRHKRMKSYRERHG